MTLKILEGMWKEGSKAAKSVAEETSLANAFGGILFSHRRDNASGTN